MIPTANLDGSDGSAASRRIRDKASRGMAFAEEQDTNATPSYCSTDPAYLEGGNERHVRFETGRLIPMKQSPEPEQLDWSKSSKFRQSLVARAYWGLPGLARFALIVLPFVSMFAFASVYIFSGDDVLGLSADAFILVAANVGVLTLIADFMVVITEAEM
ncbi:hypothetical protein IL306_007291 [Fusarium sp. DS 682]|nr:hypothetical protein IL306_007291 [Fusarium sp. DS 682]